MRPALLFITLVVASFPACNRSSDEAPTEAPTEAPAADRSIPWPPPGGQKAPPPPEVVGLFELVTNGFNAKNGAAVGKLFINELAFRSVSQCDDPAIIRDVLAGRDATAKLAAEDHGLVAFKGITEGYLLDVPAGGKPGPCTARQPVSLYLARFTWDVGGKAESREAHFMHVGDSWFIAKF